MVREFIKTYSNQLEIIVAAILALLVSLLILYFQDPFITAIIIIFVLAVFIYLQYRNIVQSNEIRKQVEYLSPKDEYKKLSERIFKKFPPAFYYLDTEVINQINSVLSNGKNPITETGKKLSTTSSQVEGKTSILSAGVGRENTNETTLTTEIKRTDALSCVNIIKILLESKQVVLDLLNINVKSNDENEIRNISQDVYFSKKLLNNDQILDNYISQNKEKLLTYSIKGEEVKDKNFIDLKLAFKTMVSDLEENSEFLTLINLFSKRIKDIINSYAIIEGEFVLDENPDAFYFTFFLKDPITQKKSKENKSISIKFKGNKSYFIKTFYSNIGSTKSFNAICFVKIFHWDEENLSLTLLPIAIF